MNRFLLLPTLLLVTACSASSSDEKPTLEGERISIIELQQELRPSEGSSVSAIDVPPAIINKEWPQAGGYAHHDMQNLAFGNANQLERVWNASIGRGSTKELPLNARPILADGRVIALDTKATIRAFHDQTGKKLWTTNVGHEREKEPVIAGGIAQDEGVLYVTSGYNEVLALNPTDGSIIWREKVSAPSRAAPTIKNGRVFVTTLNNNVIALNAKDGKIIWEYEEIAEATGLLGAASPAVDESMVIAALSSGDLVALRADTGAVLWEDNLSNTLRFGRTGTGLSDIRGYPVITRNNVIAVSYGGKIVSLDKKTGRVQWQQEISSAETPWVAGNGIFVLNSDNQLIALNVHNGEIIWITEVPKYKNPKKKKTPLSWTGPIMAGDRLLLASSQGIIAEYNPATGEQTTQWKAGGNIQLPPILANGALYILNEEARVSAYR